MIVVDANLLIYAYTSSFPQHDAAGRWLEEQLVSASRIALPWPSLLAFVRVVTNPRVLPEPDSVSRAWAQVEHWLNAEAVWTPGPTARHREHLDRCLRVPGLRANDVPDAHLAALAVEHGLRLASADSGFARFPDLDWFNPLEGHGHQ